METADPDCTNSDTTVFHRLAEDLHTATSAETILERLKTLCTALSDEEAAGNGHPGALDFERAGGLPTLVVLLMGVATSDAQTDADSMDSEISQGAGRAFSSLLVSLSKEGKIFFDGWIVPELIHALRDAPDSLARLVAAQALCAVCSVPAVRTMIADAGAMGLVLAFLVDVGEVVWDKEQWGPAWDLADVLLRWETAAVHDLQKALCGPQLPLAMIARAVLGVRYDPARL
jgi:hypothetical protein